MIRRVRERGPLPVAFGAVAHERIALSLVIHNHQPVGNFGWVFEDNHRLAYAPMLDALERHPGVRVGLHYTGPLLEWLKAEKPATLARLDHVGFARRLVWIQQLAIDLPAIAEQEHISPRRRTDREQQQPVVAHHFEIA